MIRGLLGRKLGMTRIFDMDGNVIPVTVVQAGPCRVVGVKEKPRKRVVLVFETVKPQRVAKPQRVFFEKLNLPAHRWMKEFLIDNSEEVSYQIGDEVKADVFRPGDFIDVTGTSKGKGFQGGMKRWNWGGGPASHGSMHHRRVGSIGASADPSRTFKGTHMPGHMGNERVTVQGLRVIKVDAEQNLVLIKGAVPGPVKGLVLLHRSQKKPYQSLEEKRAVVVKTRNPLKQSKAKAKGKKK